MGNLTNYHSHSLYCDGRAGMEDFVRFALSEGFYILWAFHRMLHCLFLRHGLWSGISWTTTLSEFHRLKEKYAGRIELYIVWRLII